MINSGVTVNELLLLTYEYRDVDEGAFVAFVC